MDMLIRILDVEEQEIDILLEREEKNGKVIWRKQEDEYPGPDFDLAFVLEDKGRKPARVSKGRNIVDSEHELRHRFEERLFEENMKTTIDQRDGFDDAVESEGNSTETFNPYDPKLIRVDTKTFSIGQIYTMINDGDIDLSPDFQRGFVWTDITRKSRLIESLLLRIPLPVFYFAQDEEGLFQVVDGVQRLTVIKSFLNLSLIHISEPTRPY